AVEPRQEREALALRRKSLRGPVGDRIERHTALFELGEHFHRAFDRTGDELAEALAESFDQLDLVGMLRKQRARALGERPAGVLALVPFGGADGGEEILHRSLIAVEELAIQVARIPVEQYAAQVEDSDGTPS